MGGQHAVAGNYQRDGISTARLTDSARCLWPSDGFRDLGVASRHLRRNAAQGLPNCSLKTCACAEVEGREALRSFSAQDIL